MAAVELIVSQEQSGRSVRSLLKCELGLSSARIGRLKRAERGLTVNGERVFTNAVLQAGERLVVDLDAAERAAKTVPISMPLDIWFEDGHLLVLNKAAPLAVIPSSLSPGEPTLANALAHYLGSGASFHPVNRLDRGTTGLMVIAKNGFVHDQLRQQLHSGNFFRKYIAVCSGVPKPLAGDIDLPIRRTPGSAIQREAVRVETEIVEAQEAHTSYRVLKVGAGPEAMALVELIPHTGRTHQLRVHMAAIGCPLVGDWLYGVEDKSLIARPALHAAGLELVHPITREQLSLTAPPPADLKKLLERYICPI